MPQFNLKRSLIAFSDSLLNISHKGLSPLGEEGCQRHFKYFFRKLPVLSACSPP